MPNAHARLKRNNISDDRAIFSTIFGNSVLLNTITQPNNTIALRISSMKLIAFTCSPPFWKPERIISANIATKSCTSNIPTAILPYRLFRSFLSDNSLTIIIVLENVSAIAMYNEVRGENPKAMHKRYPTAVVNSICPAPVKTATFPTERSSLSLSSSPNMNRSSVIPIWPSEFITSPLSTLIMPTGPTRIPVRIYARIAGCLMSLKIMERTEAIQITIVISKNTFSMAVI